MVVRSKLDYKFFIESIAADSWIYTVLAGTCNVRLRGLLCLSFIFGSRSCSLYNCKRRQSISIVV